MFVLCWITIFFSILSIIYVRSVSYCCKRVSKLLSAGKLDEAIKLAKCLPLWLSLLAKPKTFYMHYRLALRCKIMKRYEDCLRECRIALMLSANAHFELIARHMVVDSLTALGRVQEAREERKRALQKFSGKPDSFATVSALGKMLEQDKQYQDAYDVFEEGLNVIPAEKKDQRDHALAHLATLAHELDHPDLAIKWADEIIEGNAGSSPLFTAYKRAGDSYSKLGNLPKAQYHLQQTREMAISGNNKAEAARASISLGHVYYRLGNIEMALTLSNEAMALNAKITRQALVLQAVCYVAIGHYAEAKVVLLQADEIATTQGALQKISLQLVLQLSRVFSECREWDAASASLSRARTMIGQDPTGALGCDEMEAANLARQGHIEEALRKASGIEAQLPELAGSRTKYLHALMVLILVYYLAGHYETCLSYCQQYLDKPSDPVNRPKVLYYLGECQWHLGDQESAHSSWQQAVDLKIDIVEARKAQDHLTTLLKE
jgi:tetratricopeptide (TPR) repeat protein